MNKIISDLCAKWMAENKHKQMTKEYKKLQTDQDRVIFTLNIMGEYNVIPKVSDMPKNAKESGRLRAEGNKIFIKNGSQNTLCVEALKVYTQSIALAPYPSRELALSYANRSAVLIALGLCTECIQDIDRALALDYPDNLKGKLYVRKVHCLILLKNQPMEDLIKETEYWLGKISLKEEQQKLQAKLDTLRYNATKSESNVTNTQFDCTKLEKSRHEVPLPVIESYNDEIPCASDALAVKYNKQYGRHIIATRDMRAGEVIVIEEPYVLSLMQENVWTHCSNCLRVFWANIPCKYCSCAMYCSEECRDIDWKKCHDIECLVFPSMIENSFRNTDLVSLRLAVLAVKEAGSIQELRNMVEEVNKCNDPRTMGFSEDGKLHSDKYISVYHLVRNTEKRTVSDLFRRSMETSFTLYLLATRTTMFGAKLSADTSILAKNEDVTFIGDLILRHQQIIPNNIHSFNEEKDLETVECGSAVMPFCSLFNHNCNPNIFRLSRSKHMIVWTLYPIRKGEQLLDNYGQHYAITSKAQRQASLSKEYFFTCDCVACREDWPMYLELKSFETLVKKKDDMRRIIKALTKFNNYVDLATADKVLDKPYIIDDLLMMIEVLYECAPMPCAEMNNVVETLKRVYDLSGNRFVIPELITLEK